MICDCVIFSFVLGFWDFQFWDLGFCDFQFCFWDFGIWDFGIFNFVIFCGLTVWCNKTFHVHPIQTSHFYEFLFVVECKLKDVCHGIIF